MKAEKKAMNLSGYELNIRCFGTVEEE